MKRNTFVLLATAQDYREYMSKVTRLKGSLNRSLDDTNIIRMLESVRCIGVSRAVVVLKTDYFGVKDGLYLLDGQHLTAAINQMTDKELYANNTNFCVIEVSLDNLKEMSDHIIKMNTTAKNWGLENFLNHFVELGVEAYTILHEIYHDTKKDLNGLVDAYVGSSSRVGFKAGDFKILKEQGDETLDFYARALQAGMVGTIASFKGTVRFCNKFKNFNKGKMLVAIKRNVDYYFVKGKGFDRKYFQTNLEKDATFLKENKK